jgi:hypothetical protein
VNASRAMIVLVLLAAVAIVAWGVARGSGNPILPIIGGVLVIAIGIGVFMQKSRG